VAYRFPLVLTVIVFILLRLPGNTDWLSIPFWGSMVIQIAIALFLLFLTQTFGIIRHKTLLPAFLYLLFTGTNRLFFQDLTGSVSALIVVLCLLFLFDSYQNPLSQRNAFNISLLLTLGSFYWFPIILFFPLFWFGMYRFRCLTFQTFFASLMGFVLIYLFIFTWSIYKNDLSIFLSTLPDFQTLGAIQFASFEMKDWIVNGYVIVLLILAGVKIFMAGVSEKIQAMTTLGYLYVFSLVVYTLYLVQNQLAKEWALILYIPLSLLIAHFFTLSYKRWSIRLFLFTIVFFLVIFDWERLAVYFYM
jgi:hypothetical protein